MSDLADATIRAEDVLAQLEPQLTTYPLAVQLRLRGLRTLACCAHEELQRAERFALERIGQRMAREQTKSGAVGTVFSAGTILSCPSCGEGLYKVTARVTTEDLVMDDGTLVVPLNQTIPSRDAWTSLSCPFCGGRLFMDGQRSTPCSTDGGNIGLSFPIGSPIAHEH